MKAQAILARGLRTARILWGALTASTVLVAVVAGFVQPDPKQALPASTAGALGVVALVVAVLSFVLPERLLANALRARPPEVLRPEPVPGVPPLPARFAQPDRAARQALGFGQQSFILSMALSEAVSLFGLVLHMLGGVVALAAPFFAAGTLLALVRFPTPGRLYGAFERAAGASFAATLGGAMY